VIQISRERKAGLLKLVKRIEGSLGRCEIGQAVNGTNSKSLDYLNSRDYCQAATQTRIKRYLSVTRNWKIGPYHAGLLGIAGRDSKDGQRITSLVVCRGTGWILVCDAITGYVDPIFIGEITRRS
jgi:hypothetical protein